jgi:hypothetical protein
VVERPAEATVAGTLGWIEALAAGVSIFELARLMGTTVKMIDRTYGHLAQAEEATRAWLEARAGGLGVEEAFSPLVSFESVSM